MIEQCVAEYIESHGIKKTAVGRAIGRSQPVISKTLSGRRKFTVSEYFGVCDFLEVPYDRFVKEAREREKEQSAKDRG